MIVFRTINRTLCLSIMLCAAPAFASAAPDTPNTPLPYTGTNISGGEFGHPKLGVAPVYGKKFIYPTEKEYRYFASKGMNIFRIPFNWEILQPDLQKELVPAELERLKDAVEAGTGRGLVVILDPHNYARHYGRVIGGPDVSAAAFADFWGRLAGTFKGNPRVWFGLMNEPNKMPTEQWLEAANAAVAAIRKTGAKQRILVPGNSWSGAHSWIKAGNDLLLQIRDPANNYAFEAHQYLDSDSSGTHAEVVRSTIGSERLRSFVAWCRKNRQQAFLGEFGVPPTETGRVALQDMLRSMERDRDVWLGYTWWSAGAWWGDYMFSISPKGAVEKPQIGYLQPHLQKTPVSAMAP
ncbi:MAG: glycoside hydrolase family 5 protein [Armatimonadota bacterium]